MKKVCCLAIVLFFLAGVHAQKLTGVVQTKAGTRIESATINILNTDKTTITDKVGNFSFPKINAGSYQLSFSAVGFATQLKTVAISSTQQTTITITLIEQSKQLAEVVVTADKVEANLQKTPLAVTALNAKQLQEYRVWTISDLTALAPSTFIVEHGNSTGSNFLNIRGAMGFSNDQAVATYVDGVYQFDYFSAPINFSNIERVEILRGPQGTLYGRNAFGGVLNVITKRPTNKTSGFAEVDFGNYGQQRYSVGFNTAPIKNKLFLNAGFQ